MPRLSEQEARDLLGKVLALSQADACEANLNGNDAGNIRYARNTVTTAGKNENMTVVVQSNYGQRSGTATVNEFDDESLERAVRRSEELAKLAPEDEEFMEPLGPQDYLPSHTWHQATAEISADARAEAAASSIERSAARDCVAAGFLNDSAGFAAMANTNGLFAYNPSTSVNFSLTARTADAQGSGYVRRDLNDATKLDTDAASDIAIEKAVASHEARAIEPGRYTVILEPEASVGLIQNMIFNMDARRANEGRSFMANPGGGTRVGEQLLDERVSITSDPSNTEAPVSPWLGDGRPRERTDWIKNGVVENLYYSRFWAQKNGVHALPAPGNFIMAGGDASLEDLIRDTRRGVLVTRTWYIRTVDPRTLLYTGLTRDGTFFIENGSIKHAVKNFRFNESPVIMLNNLDELGRPERSRGYLIPPMRVRDFTFTSLSDAV
jgi:predicted Zn-dependent protease